MYSPRSASGASGANPTGSVGTSAVNGSALTFLRSDGAPALNLTIAPTWTGIHQFTPTGTSNTNLRINHSDGTPRVRMGVDTAAVTYGMIILGNATTGYLESDGASTYLAASTIDVFYVNGSQRASISATQFSLTASATVSTSPTTGSFITNGGMGIAGALFIGGTLSVTGVTTLTGLVTANGGVTLGSAQVLKLGNTAVTGLTAGVLAATTNASIVITDSTGQAYRIPCII